jgi:preprotein translocase subunit YajC
MTNNDSNAKISASTTSTTAAGAVSPAGSSSPMGVWGPMTPMLLLLVAFYFLIMRPQQKREAKRRDMINSTKRGDRIVTSGGIIGRIHKVVNEKEVALDIAEDVRIRILRTAIAEVLEKGSALEAVGDVEENDSLGVNSKSKTTSPKTSRKK